MSVEAIVSIVFGVVMFFLASLALVQGYKYRFRTPVTPVPAVENPMSPLSPPMRGVIDKYDHTATVRNLVNG